MTASAPAHADVDALDYADAAGVDTPPADLASLQQLAFTDPSQVLAQLRRASAVEELGEETIFGVPTKKYRATVEGEQPFVLAKLLA